MEKVDRLSRRPDQKVEIENDNSNQVLIKDPWICSLSEVVIEGPEVEVVEKIKKARDKDEKIVRIVEKIKEIKVIVLQGNEQQIKGEFIIKKEKVYVSKNEELRVEIIQLHHDVLTPEHRIKWKIIELVMRNYWQLGLTRDVEQYVEGYDICQRMKNKTEIPVEKLKLSKVPEKL